jgi:hypothetical protein
MTADGTADGCSVRQTHPSVYICRHVQIEQYALRACGYDSLAQRAKGKGTEWNGRVDAPSLTAAGNRTDAVVTSDESTDTFIIKPEDSHPKGVFVPSQQRTNMNVFSTILTLPDDG